MFRIPLDTLTNSLVETLLPHGKSTRPETSALHFFYDVSLLSRVTEPTVTRFERRLGLHLVYVKPPGSAYIHVFSAETKAHQRKAIDVQEWTHQVSHDSEWRHTHAFNAPYFRMAQEINDARVADGFATVAPITMSEEGHTTAGLFQPLFEWVNVHVSKDMSDEHGYRRSLRVIS